MLSGRRPTVRTAFVAVAATAACLVSLNACAQSNAARGTSHTSLTSAAQQAQLWVEGAVTAAVPLLPAKTVDDRPSEACDSNSGRNAARYEVTVKTASGDVDRATLAAWHALAGNGFTLNATSAPASGTDPVAPGAGSPSWTITGTHDGFHAEVVGNRSDPSVRVRVITPCFGT